MQLCRASLRLVSLSTTPVVLRLLRPVFVPVSLHLLKIYEPFEISKSTEFIWFGENLRFFCPNPLFSPHYNLRLHGAVRVHPGCGAPCWSLHRDHAARARITPDQTSQGRSWTQLDAVGLGDHRWWQWWQWWHLTDNPQTYHILSTYHYNLNHWIMTADREEMLTRKHIEMLSVPGGIVRLVTPPPSPAKPSSLQATSRRLAVSPSFQRKSNEDFESAERIRKRRLGRIGSSVGNAHLGTLVSSCIACLKHLGSRDTLNVMQASISVKMDDRSCFLWVTATLYITRVVATKGAQDWQKMICSRWNLKLSNAP